MISNYLKFILFVLLCWIGTTSRPALAKPPVFFHLGIIADTFSGVNQNDARVALNLLLAKHLVRSWPDYQSETIIYPDTLAALPDIRSGRVDMLTLSSMDFIAVRDQIEMVPEFISGIGPEQEQAFVLLVKRAANRTVLADLRGKHILVEKGVNGKLGLRWIDTLLLAQGLPESNRFFNEIRWVDKSSRALLPVFFGQADGCIVRNFAFDTMKALNPQVDRKLVVLQKSPVLASILLCFRPGIAPDLARSIITFVEQMPYKVEYRQVLLLFQANRILRFKPKYMQTLEELLKRYQQLKNRASGEP